MTGLAVLSEAVHPARPTARAVFGGSGAMRALDAGGSGRLEIAFGRGGYVRLGVDRWILLAPPRAPAGPLSLVVVGLGEFARAGATARVDDGTLVVGPTRIDLAHVRTRVPGTLRSARCTDVAQAWRAAQAALEVWPAPPARLQPGLRALRAGRVDEAVAKLAGLGDGLTPAGDDALAGYAAWRRAIGDPLTLSARASGRSSPLGLAYLRCAERGELPDVAAALVTAILAGDTAVARRRSRALHAWGTTSGPAILWGIASGSRPDTKPPYALT